MATKRVLARAERCAEAAGRIARRSRASLWACLLLVACSAPQPPGEAAPDDPPPPTAPRGVEAAAKLPAAKVSPSPIPVEPPPQAIVDEDNIFFSARSANVDEAGADKLRVHALRLAQDRKATVVLVGHTDGQGSRSYDLAITEERLVAVEKLLRQFGVSGRQIRRNRSAAGNEFPACQTDACQQQQRRVELRYLP